MYKAKYIVLILCCCASLAHAQDAQNASTPRKLSLYVNGNVDVFSGEYSFQSTDLSVGSGEFPSRLDLVRRYNLFSPAAESTEAFAQGASSNFHSYAACQPCSAPGFPTKLSIGLLGKTYEFLKSGSVWENGYEDGASAVELSNGGLELKTHEGMRVVFAPSYNGSSLGCGANCRVPVYLETASGESLIFKYETLPTGTWPLTRLTSVVNSRGYGISFSYVNVTASGLIQESQMISSATAFRTGCVSGVVNCAAGILGTVSYGYTNLQTRVLT